MNIKQVLHWFQHFRIDFLEVLYTEHTLKHLGVRNTIIHYFKDRCKAYIFMLVQEHIFRMTERDPGIFYVLVFNSPTTSLFETYRTEYKRGSYAGRQRKNSITESRMGCFTMERDFPWNPWYKSPYIG